MSITVCENLALFTGRPKHGEIAYEISTNRDYYYNETKEKYFMLTYLDNFLLNAVDEYAAYDATGKKLASWAVEEGAAKPTYINCRNCGAPVKGHRCEYCGTQY